MAGNWSLARFSRRGQHASIVLGVGIQLASALVALWFVAVGFTHPLWIFVPMGFLYFGQGLFMPHLTAIAVNMAPARAVGVGSSTLGFLNQSASALCVQLMGLVGAASALPMLEFCVAAAVLQLVVVWLSPRMETPLRGDGRTNLAATPERA
jgi:hypothetical protein